MTTMPDTGAVSEERPRRFKIGVGAKFFASAAAATLWVVAAMVASGPWIATLAGQVGAVAAAVIVTLVAVVPGWLDMFLAFSLVQDERPRSRVRVGYPRLSVVVVAKDAEATMHDTLQSLDAQRYPARLDVLVVDAGSRDGTRDAVHAGVEDFPSLHVRLMETSSATRADAMDAGLRGASHEYVAFVDAGDWVHPDALRRVTARLMAEPPNTAFVSGAVLVRNSRDTLMSRVQEWEYFLAQASVKRQQALYQGTLAAQSAFALYRRDIVIAVGGWPSARGEEYALTRKVIAAGYRVGYEATAVVFTRVPTGLREFVAERRDWAHGVLEGMRSAGPVTSSRELGSILLATDVLGPLLDLTYTLLLVPGVYLAFTGRFWLIGPMLLFVLPATALVTWVTYREQRRVFDDLGLRIRRNPLGYAGYLFFYRAFTAPFEVLGYAEGVRAPSSHR